MLTHFGYAIALVFGTTFIHGGCTVALIGWIRSLRTHHWALRNAFTRVTVIATLVFSLSLAGYLESALWASFYWAVDAFPNIDDALYFSLVTYTTLGYGDITLGKEWRIMAGFEAVNGIIMFGWSTALIVAVAQRLYFPHPERGLDS